MSKSIKIWITYPIKIFRIHSKFDSTRCCQCLPYCWGTFRSQSQSPMTLDRLKLRLTDDSRLGRHRRRTNRLWNTIQSNFIGSVFLFALFADSTVGNGNDFERRSGEFLPSSLFMMSGPGCNLAPPLAAVAPAVWLEFWERASRQSSWPFFSAMSSAVQP